MSKWYPPSLEPGEKFVAWRARAYVSAREAKVEKGTVAPLIKEAYAAHKTAQSKAAEGVPVSEPMPATPPWDEPEETPIEEAPTPQVIHSSPQGWGGDYREPNDFTAIAVVDGRPLSLRFESMSALTVGMRRIVKTIKIGRVAEVDTIDGHFLLMNVGYIHVPGLTGSTSQRRKNRLEGTAARRSAGRVASEAERPAPVAAAPFIPDPHNLTLPVAGKQQPPTSVRDGGHGIATLVYDYPADKFLFKTAIAKAKLPHHIRMD